MTPEQAMAEVAIHIYNQHVRDNRYHAALSGYPCGKCRTLGDAAATLQERATASIGLTGALEVRP